MANEKRLIDANDVYALFDKNGTARLHVADIDVITRVDAVEVVHAHWYAHHGITICSHCQAMFDTDLTMLQVPSTWNMPNYCPNCGAKMDGGNDR